MKKMILSAFLTCGGFLPMQAHALAGTCTTAALPVAFGSYNPLSASPVDSTGQVSVTCTGIVLLSILTLDVNYTISLSKGGSGTYSPRKMSLLSNTVNYNLYTDNARSSVWGDATGGTSTVSDSYSVTGILATSVTRNYTVYGRIPGSQNIVAGAYLDTITVTVNY